MSNAFSSTLKPGAFSNALVTIGKTGLASLKSYSRKFVTDTLRPGATLQVPLAASGSTGQVNPTNLESGDGSATPITIAVSHVTQSWHVSQEDRNYGFTLESLAQVNAQTFATQISNVLTAIMTTANYGAAIQVGVKETFSGASLGPVLAAAKNFREKNLILDGGHLGYLLPTDKLHFALGEAGAYGFDRISQQNSWSGAATNACGFCCAPDALAVGAGFPIKPSTNSLDEVGTFIIPDIELPVMFSRWFNTATGVQWAMFETMLGAAPGDTTQGKILTT